MACPRHGQHTARGRTASRKAKCQGLTTCTVTEMRTSRLASEFVVANENQRQLVPGAFRQFIHLSLAPTDVEDIGRGRKTISQMVPK